jgi:hypothetical protein
MISQSEHRQPEAEDANRSDDRSRRGESVNISVATK